MTSLWQTVKKGCGAIALTISLSYCSFCLFLFVRQRQLIFNPTADLVNTLAIRTITFPIKPFGFPLPQDNASIAGGFQVLTRSRSRLPYCHMSLQNCPLPKCCSILADEVAIKVLICLELLDYGN
jgi:hypothetical protein